MTTTRKPRGPKIDMTTPQAQAETQEVRLQDQITEEAAIITKKYLSRPKEYIEQHFTIVVMCAAAMAGIVMGFTTRPMMERQTQMATISKAMATAVPVVRALEVDMDPGKYTDKLVDIVMSVNRGGVYKSGKGLYLQELEGGMSLVIFESAFPQFFAAWGIERPDEIPSRLIGKYVKARGTIKRFNNRLSLIVYAPGLISEIPLP